MKALTIHQPWATLIALGEKRFETRSWPTKYRGMLAIHAGKQIDLTAMMETPIKEALIKHGIVDWTKLPFGQIVATTDLTDCYKVSRPRGDDGPVFLTNGIRSISWAGRLGQEYYFGDYTDGRYAWEMKDVRRMEAIPAKGQQGLWNWTIPTATRGS